MPIQPGIDIGGYHILEQLGEGGMAVVYKAYDTQLEIEVALKFIRTENILPKALEKARKRFMVEAKKMSRLDHPHIVKVTDYGEYEGTPYLVMPFISGGTLKQKLGKPVDWREAVEIILPIADALGYAHRHDLVHRDVKPSNILLTADGRPMLSDFGIAKVLESEETLDLTTTGMGIGTPEYMAPEQAEGKPVDARADVYSLGIVLYELVTGRKPFTADTPLAVLIKHSRDPLPKPSSFISGLPDWLEKALYKSLSKAPQNRFASTAEFAVYLKNKIPASPAAPGQAAQPVNKPVLNKAENKSGARSATSVKASDESRRYARKMPILAGVILFAAAAALIVLLNKTGKAEKGSIKPDVQSTQMVEDSGAPIINPTASPTTTPKEWALSAFDPFPEYQEKKIEYFPMEGLISVSYILEDEIRIHLYNGMDKKEIEFISLPMEEANKHGKDYRVDDINYEKKLMIISFNNSIGIYDLSSDKETDFIGPKSEGFIGKTYGYIAKASFIKNSNSILLVPANGLVLIYNLENREIESNFKEHNGPVQDVIFSPIYPEIASFGREDNKIFLWSLDDKNEVTELINCKDLFSFSPDGKYFAYVTMSDQLIIINTLLKKPIVTYENDFNIHDIAFSPDSARIAIGGQASLIKVIDIGKGQVENEIPTDFSAAEITYLNNDLINIISGYEEVNCRYARPITEPLIWFCDESWFQKIAIYNLSQRKFEKEFDWPEGIINNGYFSGQMSVGLVDDINDTAIINFGNYSENQVYFLTAN